MRVRARARARVRFMVRVRVGVGVRVRVRVRVTINYFHPIIEGWRVGAEVRTEERYKTGFGVISVHIHDASGLCHKSSGFGMRRVGYGE